MQPQSTPIPDETRVRIQTRDAGLCQKCLSSDELAVRHIRLTEEGGSDEDDNLVLLCHDCERAWRQHYDPTEPFAQWVTTIPATKLQMCLTVAQRFMATEAQELDAADLLDFLAWLWQQHRAEQIAAARATIARQREEDTR